MRLIQRLKNLWNLSNYPLDTRGAQAFILTEDGLLTPKIEPKKAIIIKRKTPADKFLNNEK